MAEHGKLRDVTIEQLRPGMKVHQPIVGVEGKELVGAGEVLSNLHCDKLKKWENQEKPRGKMGQYKKGEAPVRQEWQGGWKPSHFNPSVKVTNTLGEPDEFPKVEKNVELSRAAQDRDINPRKSHMAPDLGVESPLFRRRALENDIAGLEETIGKLGGEIPEAKNNLSLCEQLEERKEDLTSVRDELIESLQKPQGKDERAKRAKKSAKK